MTARLPRLSLWAAALSLALPLAGSAAEVPAAPAAPVATVGLTEVHLEWESPPVIEGYPITGWEYGVRAVTAPAYTWRTITGGGPSTTRYSVLNVPDGTWVFSVRARNANGTGHQSPHSNAVTLPALPAPEKPTATPIRDGIYFRWRAVNASPPATGYEYEIREEDAGSSRVVDWTAVGPAPTANSYRSLNSSKRYQVRIRAISPLGKSDSSPWSDGIKPGNPVPVVIVTNSHPAPLSIAVWWSENGEASPPMNTLEYQWRAAGDDSAEDDTGWSSATATTLASPFRISNLEAATEYEFRLRGTNARGSGPWTETSTQSTSPAATVQFSSAIPLNVNEDDSFDLVIETTNAPDDAPVEINIAAAPGGKAAMGPDGTDRYTTSITPPSGRVTVAILGDADTQDDEIVFQLRVRDPRWEVGDRYFWKIIAIDTGNTVHRTIEFSEETPERVIENRPFDVIIKATPPATERRPGTVTVRSSKPHKLTFGPRRASSHTFTMLGAEYRIEAVGTPDTDAEDVHASMTLRVATPGYVVGERGRHAVHINDPGDTTTTPVPAIPTAGAVLGVLLTAAVAEYRRRRSLRQMAQQRQNR